MRYDSNRDYTLDLACGILIIRMVLRHVLQWSQVTHYDIYEWLNIFFYIMPWFYFKSGTHGFYCGSGADIQNA